MAQFRWPRAAFHPSIHPLFRPRLGTSIYYELPASIADRLRHQALARLDRPRSGRRTTGPWARSGATSNPIIISDLIKTGRFDDDLEQLIEQKLSDEQIAWQMTDKLVSDAQAVFLPVWEQTHGNDGYVSFELDPLLEDPQLGPPHAERVARYVELGKKWSTGHHNRMIKVPATPAGLDALETLAAAGITLNVTLIFTHAAVSGRPRRHLARRRSG